MNLVRAAVAKSTRGVAVEKSQVPNLATSADRKQRGG